MTFAHRLLLATLVLVVLPCLSALAAQSWQLVFEYDASNLSVYKASPIGDIGKHPKTPGLETAPVIVTYDASWYDNQGRAIFTSDIQIPLGLRAPLDGTGPCEMVMPEEGVAVVRVDGPVAGGRANSPATIVLSRKKNEGRAVGALTLPAPFLADVISVDIERIEAGKSPLDGPIGVEQIRQTGPDDNRFVLVILGDGYTAENLTAGKFEQDADGLEAAFLNKSPWDLMLDATNIYRVDVESNEEGADHETFGVLVSTYFNSSFWVNDIERLLALTGIGYTRAVNTADAWVGPGVWDAILVLVNSTKYGGSGGTISVSSVHPTVSEIVLHELGHSFAGLADEYETPYPGFPPGDGEPNVDFDFSGPALKWNIWVDVGTPLPTPETSTWNNKVGAFEGARYLSSGIYRPWLNCEMRALGNQFDPVCKEAHILEFTDRLSLTDAVDPIPGGLMELPVSGQTFSVDPLPIDGISYQWYLNGDSILTGVDSSYTLMPAMLDGGNNQLAVVVSLETALVRKTSIWTSATWTVTAPASCCVNDRGNVDASADEEVTLADLTVLIDHLFVTLTDPVCWEEANVDESAPEGAGSVTLGDLTVLVDHLFVSLAPLPPCP